MDTRAWPRRPTTWRVEKQMRGAVESAIKRGTYRKVRRKKIQARQIDDVFSSVRSVRGQLESIPLLVRSRCVDRR